MRYYFVGPPTGGYAHTIGGGKKPHWPSLLVLGLSPLSMNVKRRPFQERSTVLEDERVVRLRIESDGR